MVYEKRSKKPIRLVVGGKDNLSDIDAIQKVCPSANLADTTFDNETKEVLITVGYNDLRKHVPNKIYNHVYMDNVVYLREKQVFAGQFFRLMYSASRTFQ